MAYYTVEPFGEYRADLRSAITSCVIANGNRGKNKKPFKVSDFMPSFEKKKEMTGDEIKSFLKGIGNGKGR